MTDVSIPPAQSTPAPGGPGESSEDELRRLQDLHTRLLDTLDGYDKVLEKAEPDFAALVEEFRTLHTGQTDGVRALLRELGQPLASDGSLMGTVNRAVVEIRSWFDDIGHNVLDGLVDGEKRLLESFEAARDASPSIERRGRIDQMRAETLLLLQRHAPEKL